MFLPYAGERAQCLPENSRRRGDTLMGEKRWTLTAICTATFMLLLDITIVQVALPQIQEDLHASIDGLQWVVDAYALPLSALIVTLGITADRYGRRLIFLTGIAVFTIASAICGL